MTLLLLLKPGGGTATAPIITATRSVIASAMASALSVLGGAVGQSLTYRLTNSGSWTTLTGALLQQGAPVVLTLDGNRQAVMAPQSARLKVPTNLVHFIPGKDGAQIQDQNGTIWQVVGVDHANGQSIYELQRAIYQSQGTDRGIVP